MALFNLPEQIIHLLDKIGISLHFLSLQSCFPRKDVEGVTFFVVEDIV